MAGDVGATADGGGGILARVASWWQRPSAGGDPDSRILAADRGAIFEDLPPDVTLMAAAEDYVAARQSAGTPSHRRRFEVDIHVSRLGFCARFLGFLSVRGTFGSWSATIDFMDGGDPLDSRVHAEVRTASLRTGIALRDRHLRGKRFLHAAAFPVITFRGGPVESDGTHFTTRGRLTLRGVTREEAIEFVPVPPLPGVSTPPLSLRFRGSLSISRSAYGIWSPPTIGTCFGLRPRIIGDTVKVEFEVLAVSEHFSATVSSARSGRQGGAADR